MDHPVVTEGARSEQSDTALPSASNLPEMTTHVVEASQTVRYASNEMVRQASEKVFRLHTRLFSELAK